MSFKYYMKEIKAFIRYFLILATLSNLAFPIHGKVIFFDKTYVVGQITKIDEAKIHIIPMGLETSEGILVANVDTLRLEDGKIAVLNSSVKFLYQNGKITENNDDWLDEYDDFKYDQDISSYDDSYKYKGKEKTNQAYYKISIFGAGAIALGMKDTEGISTGSANPVHFGIGFQAPYLILGAVDASPGAYLMLYGYDDKYMGKVNAYQMVANGSFDLNPIFFFFPDWFHFCFDIGLSYNNKIKVEPGNEIWTDGSEPIDNFGGFGLNAGPSFNFSSSTFPMELHLFSHLNLVPQNGEWAPAKTPLLNFGANIVIVMKRGK